MKSKATSKKAAAMETEALRAKKNELFERKAATGSLAEQRILQGYINVVTNELMGRLNGRMKRCYKCDAFVTARGADKCDDCMAGRR